MSLLDFTIIVEKDDPSGWHAYAPELPGCHSFADTPVQAKEELSEAILAYLLEKKVQKKSVVPKVKFIEHLSIALPA